MEESFPSHQETATRRDSPSPVTPGENEHSSQQLSNTGLGSQAADQSLFDLEVKSAHTLYWRG